MATDVTASTIAMEEDKRDEDRKKSTIDLAKLEADVAALKALGTVRVTLRDRPKRAPAPGWRF